MIPSMVNKVRKLSQDEGLFDDEIAEILKFSRATINRARHSHEIPKVNLDNRMDKHFECIRCKEIAWIRRKDRIRRICLKCRGKKLKEFNQISIDAHTYLRNKVLANKELELQ